MTFSFQHLNSEDDFVPLPVSETDWFWAHDLMILATLAWRHRIEGMVSHTCALEHAGSAYLTSVLQGLKSEATHASISKAARAAALVVLQREGPALVSGRWEAKSSLQDMLTSVHDDLVEHTANMFTTVRAMETLKQSGLKRQKRLRDRLDLQDVLSCCLTAVSELQDERSAVEVRFAYVRAMPMQLYDVRHQVRMLLEGRPRSLVLSDEDRELCQSIRANLQHTLSVHFQVNAQGFNTFDKEGREIQINEDAQVALGVAGGLDYWRRNGRVCSPSHVHTRVKTLFIIYALARRSGRSEMECLSMPWSLALLNPIDIDADHSLVPMNWIRGEWISSFANNHVYQIGPRTLPGIQDIRQRIQQRMVVDLERALLESRPGATLGEAFLKERSANGFYDLYDDALEVDVEGLYPFQGGQALLWTQHDESMAGVTACAAGLSAWNAQGQLLGQVSARYMRGKATVRWDRFDRERYIFTADACDDVWTTMAQALCDELGDAPKRPVVVLTSMERHPDRTEPGFGRQMVVELLRQLRRQHAYLRSFAVHVAPAQFDWADVDEVPASINVQRIEVVHKLTDWVHHDLAPALAEVGVDLVAVLSRRTSSQDDAMNVLVEELKRDLG